VFSRMYSQVGRPSIAPERVLKSLLLIALHSVRSERQFCEQLQYNLLFRCFLDMELEENSFDATVFSKNRAGWIFMVRNAATTPIKRKTDPESLLAKKGAGKEAKLCYGAPALMENRNGLLVDLTVTQATGFAEREAAQEMIKRQRRRGALNRWEQTRTMTRMALWISCVVARSFPMSPPTPNVKPARPLMEAPRAMKVTARVRGYGRESKRSSVG